MKLWCISNKCADGKNGRTWDNPKETGGKRMFKIELVVHAKIFILISRVDTI